MNELQLTCTKSTRVQVIILHLTFVSLLDLLSIKSPCVQLFFKTAQTQDPFRMGEFLEQILPKVIHFAMCVTMVLSCMVKSQSYVVMMLRGVTFLLNASRKVSVVD